MYFSKVLNYHFIKDKSRNNVAAVLQVNPYFVREYEFAANNYSVPKLESVISLLRESDMRSKGVRNATVTEGELLKELVYKITH